MSARAADRIAGRARAARLLGAVLALAVAACGERAERAGATADGPPTYGGTVVVAGTGDLDYANGLVSGEKYTADILANALFMPLVRYDEALEYEPYLAESWEMLGDTGVVFRLRRDVRWHDGPPTTAYDVAFTYERAKDPETAFTNASAYFGKWRDVEVVDSFTVRFSWDPHVDPMAGLPSFPIMPRHLLESVPPAQLRQVEFNNRPVGNGPFRFVEYRSNDRWVFEANPDFPQALGGRPYLDRFVYRVVPETSAKATEILSGNVDLAIAPRSHQVRELDARPELRAIVKPTRMYQFIAWNGRHRPFGDARVRRALTLAIDRQEILDALRAGIGELASGPVNPDHWAYDDELAPLPFDTVAARALLAEAGYEDRNGDGTLEDEAGRAFEFAMTIPAGSDYNHNMATMIQADLAEIGVRMRLRPTDGATMIEDLTSPERRYEAAYMAWNADLRLSLTDLFHSAAVGEPFQLSSYSNPELDRLLDETVVVTDRDSARRIWREIQSIMKEDQPYSFMFYTPDVVIVNERVRGVEMDIRGVFRTLPRWWKVGGRQGARNPEAS